MEKNTSYNATPVEESLLISFIDLTGFARTASGMSSIEMFNYCTSFYEIIGKHVEAAGGTIIKFMGDGSLVIFPAANVDKGVICLYRMKQEIDSWNRERGNDSKLIVKAHFGSVAIGLLGSATTKRLDIIGNEANTCAILKSNGFAMTAELFRKLDPQTRKLFKKHTPAVTYIPVEERHRM